MSVQSNMGAEAASKEIAAFIRKRIEAVKQYRSGSAQGELETLLKFVEDLQETARQGWY